MTKTIFKPRCARVPRANPLAGRTPALRKGKLRRGNPLIHFRSPDFAPIIVVYWVVYWTKSLKNRVSSGPESENDSGQAPLGAAQGAHTCVREFRWRHRRHDP